MEIKNVRWGKQGTPYGMRCLFFDLDGRPASAFWEQKKGIVDKGYLSIAFEDGKPSHLPAVRIYSDSNPAYVAVESDRLIYSPWLNERLSELCAADPYIDGFLVGDAPDDEDEPVEESEA